MYRWIYQWRSRGGATLVLLDPLPLVLPLLVAYAGLWSLIPLAWHWFGGWALALGLVVLPRPAVMRVSAEDPTMVRITELWTVVPYRRRQIAIERIASTYEAFESTRPDVLEAAAWRFLCADADRVLAWLRTSQAALAVPAARVVASDA